MAFLAAAVFVSTLALAPVVLWCLVRGWILGKLPANGLPTKPEQIGFPGPFAPVRELVKRPKVAVVGAGAAGCVAAHLLARAGWQVTLFEAQHCLGGRAAARSVPRGRWELGTSVGADTYTPSCKLLTRLIRECRLDGEQADTNGQLRVVLPGRSVVLDPKYTVEWMKLPKTRWDVVKLLRFFFYANSSRRADDWFDPLNVASKSGSSMSTSALRGLGDELTTSVVLPLSRAVLQADPSRLPGGFLWALLTGDALTDGKCLENGLGNLWHCLIHGPMKPIDFSSDHLHPTASAAGTPDPEVPRPQDLPQVPATSSPPAAAATTPTVNASGAPFCFAAPIDVRLGHQVYSLGWSPSSGKFTVSWRHAADNTGAHVGDAFCSKVAWLSLPVESATFDYVIMAVPAPCAAPLVRSLPNTVVPDATREFLAAVQYRPALRATYLVPMSQLKKKDKVPTLVPSAECPVLWISFPSGRLGVACVPGFDLVDVMCSEDLARSILPDVEEGTAPLEPITSEPPRREHNSPARGACARLTQPQLDAARALWRHAALAEPALPAIFEDCIGIFAWRNGFPQWQVDTATNGMAAAAGIAAAQTGPLVFAGDYLSTPTVEGAARSGLWAAGSLLKASLHHRGAR